MKISEQKQQLSKSLQATTTKTSLSQYFYVLPTDSSTGCSKSVSTLEATLLQILEKESFIFLNIFPTVFCIICHLMFLMVVVMAKNETGVLSLAHIIKHNRKGPVPSPVPTHKEILRWQKEFGVVYGSCTKDCQSQPWKSVHVNRVKLIT